MKLQRLRRGLLCACLTLLAWPAHAKDAMDLAKLDTRVYPADSERAKELPRMLSVDARARQEACVLRENQAWSQVQSKADWEHFRDERIAALRTSLGTWPDPPRDLRVRVTKEREGEGYRIENLVYESRPGLWVTANLYRPAQPGKSMPGIVIVHSHHNPKTQGELQDMGMTWARAGCVVLIPDMVGHGERRQHPFVDAKSYPGTFRVGRQDYYFRYNTALQLHLIGDSLMGWMVWDIQRGIDLLLARPGIDSKRILLIGSVAGGGDPASVAAALDPRIRVVAPFNFGGFQPDYAIPENAERNFYWFGLSDWESTRCLRNGARDGFAHWVIVGSVAPRRLLLCHEFAWDQERDPAWPRLQKVFGFYDAADALAFATGKGSLKGQPPDNTHCNNVGPYHRSQMVPILKRWGLFQPPEKEFSQRLPAADLQCLTREFVMEKKPKVAHQLAAEQVDRRLAAARRSLIGLSAEQCRQQLRQDWAQLLGNVEPGAEMQAVKEQTNRSGPVTVERLALVVETRIEVPLVLLLPARKDKARLPVVVSVAQQGKEELLRKRGDLVAELLRAGVAVCLPDVRGTGETRPTDISRGRGSSGTSQSQRELMLGQPLLGSRLRDLRSVLHYLRQRKELDAERMALWGDSLGAVNTREQNLAVPQDVEQPAFAEPLGGQLALLGALFEDNVRAIYIRRGLGSFRSMLESPFVYVPHDAVVPGALKIGDLCDVATALVPRSLRLEGLVNGLNQRMDRATMERAYGTTMQAYGKPMLSERFHLSLEEGKPMEVAVWLARQLK